MYVISVIVSELTPAAETDILTSHPVTLDSIQAVIILTWPDQQFFIHIYQLSELLNSTPTTTHTSSQTHPPLLSYLTSES